MGYRPSRVDGCSPGCGARTCPWGAHTVPRPRAVAPSRAPDATVRASEGRGADGAEAPTGLWQRAPRAAREAERVAGEDSGVLPAKGTGEFSDPGSASDFARRVNGIYHRDPLYVLRFGRRVRGAQEEGRPAVM